MLLRIDDLSRPDHSLLEQDDVCFYIREYTSRQGYQHSPENQLVFNLKCPVDHASAGRLYYKQQAIGIAATDVRQALEGFHADDVVFIPIPPSKSENSPAHDPRVRNMLKPAERQLGLRVVDALKLRADRDAAHQNEDRPTVAEMAANLEVTSLDWVGAKVVVIFDDVLVTGTQFKAAVRVLEAHDPNAKFVGIFWVRRTFP
jgi:predicted amidophosphoribosyltransferase